MRGKDGVYCFTLFLTFILVVGSVIPVYDFDDNDPQTSGIVSEPEKAHAYLAGTPHAPIVIDGDTNFSATALAEGWPGDGSSGSPFVIDGLDIDLGGAAGSCIFISNTQVNFTISNCNLTGASVSPGAGIYLEDVKNARVVDNLCHQNTHGVFILGRGSKNCSLINNTCTQNIVSGIQLVACLNISLIRNNCSSNFHGINAIDLLDLGGYSGDLILASNICCNNTYGISIGDVNPEALGPMRNTVIDNNCSANSEDGISLTTPIYSSFINNSCNGNGASGIRLVDMVSHSLVVENTCNENGQSGIYLDDMTSENNFTDNLCSRNNQYGIYLEFIGHYDNDFYWNSFIDNLVGNARDEGTDTIFEYNYWSDYSGLDVAGDGFGDTPYPITGGNQDPNPLMRLPGSPPQWIETPSDQVIIYLEPFRYDLNISAYKDVDLWWVNDTINFHVDQSGIITNASILMPDRFGLQVFAIDTYSNILSSIITIIAMELSPPTWTQPPKDKLIEYGADLSYKLNAADVSEFGTWWINNTAHFTINDEGLVTTIGIIPVGVYDLQVFVNDTWGNTLNGTFSVFVIDTISPSFVILYTFAHNEEIIIQLTFEGLPYIDHYWLNDTEHFSLSEGSVINNATVLEPGVYRLEVRAYDPYDNYCSVVLVVTVMDIVISIPTTTTPSQTTNPIPEGVNPVMILSLEGGLGVVAVLSLVFVVILRRRES